MLIFFFYLGLNTLFNYVLYLSLSTHFLCNRGCSTSVWVLTDTNLSSWISSLSYLAYPKSLPHLGHNFFYSFWGLGFLGKGLEGKENLIKVSNPVCFLCLSNLFFITLICSLSFRFTLFKWIFFLRREVIFFLLKRGRLIWLFTLFFGYFDLGMSYCI